MPTPNNYRGLRCQHNGCDIGTIYADGGFWSKKFDVGGRKFSTAICERCKHTEFYKADQNTLKNIFDLFVT